jgi:hypothetical protein
MLTIGRDIHTPGASALSLRRQGQSTYTIPLP